ncbi:hypothetical protein STRDD10_00399 [Streptococcus sp. DD10]|uniref:Pr6Pr family membrane protein n=1 Tax=Streptococcus sp. DD10 TaxID=1777878 RepID=UPI000792FF74|nr:Pr6Pr family membrane protein [Streptococcus sp. DD10]KXT75197.1 hypothetical protein STRDD10_00399 [Streptococcus sp. DD10]
MRFKLIYLYRILLFMLSIVGVYLEITKHGGLGMLMYYTVLSNIIVMLFTGYLVSLMTRVKKWESQTILRFKGAVTMSIMITCVIYHFMLAPIATDFYRLENFLCHYIVPLMFFADTLLVDKRKQYRWFDPVLWTAIPLFYMAFALFNGLVTKWPIPNAKDSPFAYFFINVTKYGWQYVGTMVAIIFIAYLFSGYVLYVIKTIGKKI